MCGILAYASNDAKKFNLDKFNILGIMNETRGTDSCGVASDGLTLKGVDYQKKWRDFATFNLVIPTFHPTVIGHTRKSTMGVHSEYNAHPFQFGKHTEKGIEGPISKFLGVHNGTLINQADFAKERNIDITKEITEDVLSSAGAVLRTVKKTVTKIDSELLLESLYKDGNFSVLSEYNGAAALVWYDTENPNIMYCYHGKSNDDNSASPVLKEERPLYFYKESKNSLYVSSIENSLYVIGGDTDSVGEFLHNTVYKITDGDVENAEKFKINRDNNYQKRSFYNRNLNRHSTGPVLRGQNASVRNIRETGGDDSFSYSELSPKLGSDLQMKLNLTLPIDKGLLEETFDCDINSARGKVLMKSLRYFRNNHLCSGIYTYVPKHGYYLLSKIGNADAKSALKKLVGLPFIDGSFVNKGALTKAQLNEAHIPFSKSVGYGDSDVNLYYMYNGIRFRSYLDWSAVSTDRKFNISELSMVSSHPIIDINPAINRTKGVYFEGKLHTGTNCILGSKKKYTFLAGQVTDISFRDRDVQSKLDKVAIYSLDKAEAFLRGTEEDTKSITNYDLDHIYSSRLVAIKNMNKTTTSAASYLQESKETDTLLNSLIDNIHYGEEEKLTSTISEFKHYSENNTKARLVIECLTSFIEYVK